jgi:hypothetical protein
LPPDAKTGKESEVSHDLSPASGHETWSATPQNWRRVGVVTGVIRLNLSIGAPAILEPRNPKCAQAPNLQIFSDS